MATTPNSVITPQTVNTKGQSFVNADGTTVKDVFVAGAAGSILNMLVVQSTDSAARNIKFYYYDGTTAWPIGTVALVINAGNTGAIASVNALAAALIPGLPLDSNGNPYLKLKSGDKIQASMLVAVTAALQVSVTALGEDY